jgi:hypothetical protein
MSSAYHLARPWHDGDEIQVTGSHWHQKPKKGFRSDQEFHEIVDTLNEAIGLFARWQAEEEWAELRWSS